MAEYYNLSKFSGNSGLIDFYKTISVVMGQWFGIMLVTVAFLIPLITMVRRGEEANKALNISALYSGLLAIFLYIGQIITSSIVIYIPTMIFVITIAVRWYNK